MGLTPTEILWTLFYVYPILPNLKTNVSIFRNEKYFFWPRPQQTIKKEFNNFQGKPEVTPLQCHRSIMPQYGTRHELSARTKGASTELRCSQASEKIKVEVFWTVILCSVVALQPRKPWLKSSPLWKPQISHSEETLSVLFPQGAAE